MVLNFLDEGGWVYPLGGTEVEWDSSEADTCSGTPLSLKTQSTSETTVLEKK